MCISCGLQQNTAETCTYRFMMMDEMKRKNMDYFLHSFISFIYSTVVYRFPSLSSLSSSSSLVIYHPLLSSSSSSFFYSIGSGSYVFLNNCLPAYLPFYQLPFYLAPIYPPPDPLSVCLFCVLSYPSTDQPDQKTPWRYFSSTFHILFQSVVYGTMIWF